MVQELVVGVPPAVAFLRGFPLGLFLLFFPFLCRPSDQMGGVGCWSWARGRIPIFRKIDLCGKLAKSTHGHTNGKPNLPVFSDLVFFFFPPPQRLPWTYPAPTLQCGRL